MNRFLVMTNATKAMIIAAVNAFLVLLQAFDVGLTDKQGEALLVFVNALLVLWVGLTYDNSRKRVIE